MKDTTHLKAKFELDSDIGMTAKGQSLCTRVLVLLGAKKQRDQCVNNWLGKKGIPARRGLVEQDRDG